MEITELKEGFHNVISPVITGFVACSIVGFWENIIVNHFHFFRFERSHGRLLVFALSVVDLTSF